MTHHSTDQLLQGTATLLPALPPADAVAALDSSVLSIRVRTAGLCTTGDAAKWFPYGMGRRQSKRSAAYARAACLGCTVREECLELALRAEAEPSNDVHGVFGGTAPWEREAMLRARMAASRAAAS